MTIAKLHIDLSQGVIDIEGDPELVREIYGDFKTQLANGTHFSSATGARSPNPPVADIDVGNGAAETSAKAKAKRRATPKKATNEDASNGVVADSPKLDKNLDTSTLGAFYGQFAPKNNAEKILIFLKFMADTLAIEHPNTDQVYTCFKHTGEKIPKAFAQAFYDTSTKHGYIDFRSSVEMPITIAGDNHFNHTLKRKAAE